MTWHCHLCTYRNLNDGASRCHQCGNDRPSGGRGGAPLPAIVDLTGICSPKPAAAGGSNPRAGEGDRALAGNGGGRMESNRSRRRRRQEREQSMSRGESVASSSQRPASNSGDVDLLSGRKMSANVNADASRGSDVKRNASAASLRPQNSNPIVIDVDSAKKMQSNASNDRGAFSKKSNYSIKSGSFDGDLRRGNIGARLKRKCDGGEDDDFIADPAPHRKDIKASIQPGRRKESKLKSKRRKLEEEKRKPQEEDNTNTKQSADSVVNSEQRRRSLKENEDNGHREQSSFNEESKKKKGPGGSDNRLTAFYAKRGPPQASAEELMERANALLRQTFKHKFLRDLQDRAVKNGLQRTSQIVIMATGGGKSLCYQLPALAGGNNAPNVRAEKSSVTIVVCPLIALMIDQVNNLGSKGVRTAACLSSSQSAKTKQEIYTRLQTDSNDAKGKNKNQFASKLTPIQLLYVTPELIETQKFRGILQKLYESNRLHMFAIDEAHCLSTWGHDFRPAFRKLTWVREAFPDVPVTACTGTATAKVIQDIRDILHLDKKVPCIMGSFNRPNISYEVRFKESLNAKSQNGAIADLVSVVKKQHDTANKANQPCSGIIYVHKKADCQSLATQLTKATGLVCLAYHSGLKDAQREETQQKWTAGECNIAVATIAFGMGIDLPHVRYVIHWSMAKSLEGFYQESGRGGRDGKPSLSILYYSKEDASKFAWLIKQNAQSAAKKKGKLASQMLDHSLLELEGMVDYATKPTCKRAFVLSYFGESGGKELCQKTCDFCKDPKRVERDIQASECMSAVVNSHRLMHAGKKNDSEGQKFYHNPLDDEESLEDDKGHDDFLGGDDGLGITSYAGEEEKPSATLPKKAGFVKASSVLSKYETMECQKGKTNGFINFKTRTFDDQTEDDSDAKKHRAVNIPEHLRKGMPDPFAAYKKKTEAAPKSSSDHASEADRLRVEVAELEKQKAAMRAKMNLSSKSTLKSLPTPSLSFKKR